MPRIFCIFLLMLTTTLPVAAQTATPTPLTETYTTTMGEGLTFQYPAEWYVLETAEAIIIADSENTFTEFRDDPQAAIQPGMVAISILRPQTLALGFSLENDAQLEDLALIVSAQLGDVEPEEILLGDIEAYRFQYPPQRFDAIGFAFDNGSLYFATLAVATDTMPLYEPIVRQILATFEPVEREAQALIEIEVEPELVNAPYELLLAPITFEYPDDWTISESEFGAVQLSNLSEDGNVFDAPVEGIVRVQITFTEAAELPFGMTEADLRGILQFTASADEAILELETPYGEITEFFVGGYPAARMDAISATTELMLMVVEVENWFVTIRATAFTGELADYEPTIMALVASLILLPEPEATAEATVTP